MKGRMGELRERELNLRGGLPKLMRERNELGNPNLGTPHAKRIDEIDNTLQRADEELQRIDVECNEVERQARVHRDAMNSIIAVNLWRIDFSDTPDLARMLAPHLAEYRALMGDE